MEKHNHSRLTDPNKFGPGKWDDLHTLGIYANTYPKKMHYITTVNIIFHRLGCSTCRGDSLKYLKNHPLIEYWDIKRNGEDVGFFYWSVDFHNYVNRKLGKPEISREDAYKMYKFSEDEICEGDCGSPSPEPIIIPPVSRLNVGKRKPPKYGFVPSR